MVSKWNKIILIISANTLQQKWIVCRHVFDNMRFPGLLYFPISRWVITFLCVLAGFNQGLTQERMGGVQGRMQDSTLDRACPLVVVAILDKDSSLVRFARTRKD